MDNLLGKLMSGESTSVGETMALPEFLLEKFISRTLTMLRQRYSNKGIARLVLTSRNLNAEMREKLYGILEKLGILKDRAKVVSYTECFMYYVLSQKPDIRANDVGLFDYSEKGLLYYQLTIGRKKHPAPVVVNSYDLSAEFPYALLQMEDEERMSGRFEDAAQKLLYKRLISSLYFTGQGFEGSWPDPVLQKLCTGRRVFKGQNLYTRGACYAAKVMKEGGMDGFFFLGEDRIAGTISMKVSKNARDASVIFAKAGDDYHDIHHTIQVILEDEDTLDFTVSSLIRKEDVHIFLTLDGLSEKNNKLSSYAVSLRFADKNTAVVLVKDLGFGDIHKTSHRIWEFKLPLHEF